ncbi:hypothetical protein HDU79_009200 [Rhizoclosmatium sp. JEL0117]|nr:hypothetical protein HDU79_009200 [Rhizoclosmatium sp. JEL0117]
MGVFGLWPLLSEETRRVEALEALSAFYGATYNFCGIAVGVDASVWLHSSLPLTMRFTAFSEHSTAVSQPVTPHIVQARTLLSRCLKLVGAGVVPVFCFDFNQSDPRFEAAVAATRTNRTIKAEFARLLEILRIPWFVANKGVTAEAELARLNALGIIDAVMTDDGDAFLFGAKTIIRNWSGATKEHQDKEAAMQAKRKFGSQDSSNWDSFIQGGGVKWGQQDDDDNGEQVGTPSKSRKSKASKGVGTGMGKEYVAIYDIDNIIRKCGWNQNSLIIMAMIGGADNAPGIPGIGLEPASRLCTVSAGIADKIVPAALSNDTETLRRLLFILFDEFNTNSMGLLAQKRPSAVKNMETLIQQVCNQWPRLIRDYAVPPTKVDSPDSQNLIRQLKLYTSGWWKREYNPDVAALVEWYARNMDDTTEYAYNRVCSYVIPYLRIRALRIIGFKNNESFEDTCFDEPPCTPVKFKNKYIDRILREGPSKFGVDQVEIVWTNWAMSLFVPEYSFVPGSVTKGQLERAMMGDEEKEQEDWAALELDKSMAKYKQVWLDVELVYAVAPNVLATWYKVGSGKQRTPSTSKTPSLVAYRPTEAVGRVGGLTRTVELGSETPSRKRPRYNPPLQYPVNGNQPSSAMRSEATEVISLISDDEADDDNELARVLNKT